MPHTPGSASRRRRSVLAVAVALATMLAVAVAPPASAAPSSADLRAQAAAKKAQAAAAEARLQALRPELAKRMADFEFASEELEAARFDVLLTSARLDALDDQVTSAQALLDARAVALYKSGGLDEVALLLSTDSFGELIQQLSFLSSIMETDSRLLHDLRDAREESARLREQQERHESDVMALRQIAQARRTQVDALVEQQEQIMRSLSADIAKLVKDAEAAAAAEAALAAEQALLDGGSAPPVPFKPNTVISDANFLASGSMSVSTIQSFLERQPGDLKSYRGPDHTGALRTAAEMIAEASTYWGVSPKVVIATLQKEQSLISRAGASTYAMDWAMGCGKAESYTISSYRGFGNQVWNGARVLMKNRAGWTAGCMLPIDGAAVYPTNPATHTLYRYTPHFQGATSFWRIYWRYFGDPGVV